MSSPHRFANRRRARVAGFTLVELMIGVLIGLLSTLAVTHILVNSEGQKRTTTTGSDAQINGALALGVLQRSLQSAGYGFTSLPAVIGCPVSANYSGTKVLPDNLVPLIITDGGSDGEPDTIRVLASGKKTFSVPLRITTPGHAAAGTMTPLASTRGVEVGDLMIAARNSTATCEMFRVTAMDSAKAEVTATDGNWNPAGGPAGAYPEGDFAINMGAPIDITYSISGNSLRSASLNLNAAGAASYDAAAVELFGNVVNLQALYGKDVDDNGSVDEWDTVTPTTNADWRKVIAVRVALVSRSAQYEKENVTHANLDWDVGNGTVTDTTGATVACGSNKCLKLVIDTLPDWQHYRYRVFDTVIPLRNMLWNT